MSISIPIAAIKTILGAAVTTANGGTLPDTNNLVYDYDANNAFAQVKQGSGPWVLVTFGQPEEKEMWASRTRVYTYPIDMFWLVTRSDAGDTSDSLIPVMEALVQALQANGNRWSGVTGMNHAAYSIIDLAHENHEAWRQNGWSSAKLNISVRLDYVQG